MRGDRIRSEVLRLVRSVPFRPFVLNLENGDRIPIVHPENIAFDPSEDAAHESLDFYVLSGRMRVHASFEAVTSIASPESVELLA